MLNFIPKYCVFSSGALIAIGFYKFIGPVRPQDLSWTFENGARILTPKNAVATFVRDSMARLGWQGVKTGGWVGLSILGIVAGMVAGVAEALGKLVSRLNSFRTSDV